MAVHQGDQLDRDRFELLFRQEIGRLHNFARQYVHDNDTAMDICQRVFVRLWEKRDTLRAGDTLKSYLYTSVKNRCLNHLRDHQKYRSKILDLECTDEDLLITTIETDTDELREAIASALASLPEKCRQVFEMSRFRDMKYREIADELEISQKTVEAHMSKAMRMLREALSAYRALILFLWYLFM